MVLDRKTNFFLGKKWFWTGKPTFAQEKDGSGQENRLFPRKKMVGREKPTFSWEKDGFGKENHLFRRENQKKTSFETLCGRTPKKIVFLVFPSKKKGFGQENQLFPRKKMALDRKTNLFLGKRWFGREKPTFS